LVIAEPAVVFEAVQALKFLADEISVKEAGQKLGPFQHLGQATITMRRAKARPTPLDAFLQLIAPSGTLFAENESAFGDHLSPDLSDAAIINVAMPEVGFYRFLAKGYDKQPDNQAFGAFTTRLETSGAYDAVDVIVSANSEDLTLPQKSGTISTIRQRDSYLFQAAPGTTVHIAVSAAGSPPLPDPQVELYDPEDFLIAANDDYPGRGENAVISVSLPPNNPLGEPMPDPSTYRVVVSGHDGFANVSTLSDGFAHLRQVSGGGYQLKIFTGSLTSGVDPGSPRIDSISPPSGPSGMPVLMNGANFSSSTLGNIVRFGSSESVVTSVSSTQIVTRVPSGLPLGAVTLAVTVGSRTSNPASFIVISPEQEELPPEITGQLVSLFVPFERPGGMAADTNGNLFVLGRDSGVLLKITSAGATNVVAELGRAADAWFGPAIDPAGNLFVVHFTSNAVLKITPQGRSAHSPQASASLPALPPIPTAMFTFPARIPAKSSKSFQPLPRSQTARRRPKWTCATCHSRPEL
jgi:hypothetical protein